MSWNSKIKIRVEGHGSKGSDARIFRKILLILPLKWNITPKTLSTKAELHNLHDEKMFLSETGSWAVAAAFCGIVQFVLYCSFHVTENVSMFYTLYVTLSVWFWFKRRRALFGAPHMKHDSWQQQIPNFRLKAGQRESLARVQFYLIAASLRAWCVCVWCYDVLIWMQRCNLSTTAICFNNLNYS